MFRVEFYVQDKSLAKVLTDVAGHAMDLKVVPVVNAQPEPKTGKVRAISDDSTSYMRVFGRIKLSKVKGDRVTSTEIQQAMADEKLSDNTYSFIIRTLKEHHLIDSVSRGIFKVKAD